MVKAIHYSALIIAFLFAISSCSTGKLQENYTVGIINLNPNLDRIISEFKRNMALRGYKEGVNITYLYRGTLANPQQIDQEVVDMLNAKVDLLFTMTTPATKKVKELTRGKKLPILFAPVFSPVTSGIVDSLAKPGGMATGIKTRGSTAKTLEWFVKSVPTAKRIFVPVHYTDKAAIQTMEDLESAAEFFGVELVIRKAGNKQELDKVLSDIPVDIDAVWLTHSHLIVSNIQQIIAAATALKKPVISSTGQHEKGLMLSYAPSHEKIGKQASRMADKLLTGVSPAVIPVETADFFLSLNLKIAQAIGITIPDDVISQADIVIR